MSVIFSDLHDKMLQVVTGMLSKEKFYSWLNESVEIKEYIPITFKYAIISSISQKLRDDLNKIVNEDLSGMDLLYITYDLNIFFDILFSYLDMIVLKKYRTTENYDMTIKSGLYDYIIQKCSEDFKDFVKKCDRVTGIDSFRILVEISSVFTKTPTVEEFEKIQDIINNGIDKEKLQIMKVLEEFNNPILSRVIDKSYKDAIVENIKENIKS